MTARSVMDPNPTVLHDTDTVASGIQYIMTRRYRNIPVVGSEFRYLGVFGVHCLLRLVLPKAVLLERGLTTVPYVNTGLGDLHRRLKAVSHKPVTECMSVDASVVTPDTPLVETLLTLYHTRLSVPVVEEETGVLVGMVSYWDVGARILEQGV